MASEAQFSWRKILSFFGVALLVFVGIVTLSSGISLITLGRAFNGAATLLGGLCAFACAVLLYKDYERYSKKNRNDKPNYTR